MKALKEIVSYNTGLIEALENRFGDDFKDPFVKEIKDVLDFNFMLTLGDKIKMGKKHMKDKQLKQLLSQNQLLA